MGKPHKHAELIKAWADGAEIQQRESDDKQWAGIGSYPSWSEAFQYRLKPAPIRYRNYMYTGMSGQPYIGVHHTDTTYDPESSVQFCRWVGDWQEVKI